MSSEVLGVLKAQLVAAHAAARAGQVSETYSAYQKLGAFFAGAENLRQALFFYKKCLQISHENGWSQGEMDAYLHLGRPRVFAFGDGCDVSDG